MSKRPRGVDLEQAAADEVAGQLRRLGDRAGRAPARARRGRPGSPAGRSAAARSRSRRRAASWAESTAWSRLTVDIALLRPTSADWTATCSISSGRPPVALSRRRTSWACVAEVDLLAAGRADAAQEQLDGRALQRGALGGHRQRPDADDGLERLAGRGPRGHHDAGVGGALQHRLEHRAGLGGVEVEAVEHEQALAAVDGAAQGAGERVAGGRLRLEALAGRRRAASSRRAQVAGVDPRRRVRSAAAWRTRSVLPLPGGPTTVTQRDSSSASPSARWTSARPRQGDSTH